VNRDEAQRIRQERSSFYSYAKDFAANYGLKVVRLLESRLEPGKKNTIVVAMGGAEHLGTLVQIYFAHFSPRPDVEIQYVPLPSGVFKTWQALKVDEKGQIQNDEQGRWTVRVGIGDVPTGYKVQGSNESDINSATAYVTGQNVLHGGKIIVLDTGFAGSIPEIIHQVARNIGYRDPVEGVLLAKNKTEVAVPLSAVSHDDEEGALWAKRLDGNNSQGALYAHYFDVFQRSQTMSISKGGSGAPQVVITPITDPKELWAYKATLQGLQDGLAQGLGQ
jgi:hypothetical protein